MAKMTTLSGGMGAAAGVGHATAQMPTSATIGQPPAKQVGGYSLAPMPKTTTPLPGNPYGGTDGVQGQ